MQSSDMRVYRSLANGRKSSQQVVSGVVQNVFPHVTSAQRAAGMTDYAKTHWALANTDNAPLLNPELYLDKPTISPDDYVVMCLLGQRDALVDIGAAIEAADKVGSAVLAADIAAGATSFKVTVKAAAMLPGGADDIFRDGLTVKVCSHADATSGDGAEETKVITGNPTYSGLEVTCQVTEAFANSFTADGISRVSGIISPVASLAPSVTVPVKTSAGGVVDTDNYPIGLDNIGTPEEDFTLTWSDATTFSVSGDSLGADLGTGTVGVAFSLVDPATSRIRFTIPAGMLSGSWQAGDTLTFTTSPASIPVGQKRVVSAGAASLANNVASQVLAGEAVA